MFVCLLFTQQLTHVSSVSSVSSPRLMFPVGFNLPSPPRFLSRDSSLLSDYTHPHSCAHTRQLTAKWLFIKDRDLRGSNRLRDGNCVSH